MDQDLLRKVQLAQLSIAKEIKRVCEENNIKYFLEAGTLLGAVRHGGFIPWDDDLDIGMLREDYNRFCELAPKCLNDKFFLQTWLNDKYYALPFCKVRLKNTVYIENNASRKAKNGIYVDIFAYDNAPKETEERKHMAQKLVFIERMLLSKCLYLPWLNGNAVDYKKRVGYMGYKLLSFLSSKEKLIERYMNIIEKYPQSDGIYVQEGISKVTFLKRELFENTSKIRFEDDYFSAPSDPDEYLRVVYGDYHQLPPVERRGNRHGIIEVQL